MEIRPLDPTVDGDAARAIWHEVGWIDDSKNHADGLDSFLASGDGWVATIRGGAECIVTTARGSMAYLGATIPMSFVTSVTTSRIARKKGFAGRLTARALAADAARGALVSALGMFEQGFYNRLGYGTGGYEHIVSFDPASIALEGKTAVPVRLGMGDYEKVHRSRLKRRLGHGACRIDSPPLPGRRCS